MIDQLRKELEADEGCKYEIYLDHLGLPTFGIGHLVTKNDQEHGQPVGTPVSEERVQEAFEQDIEVTLSECRKHYNDYYNDLPEEVQLVLANMMFNLGRPRLSKFVSMKRHLEARDWNKMADEMVDSRWYNQVTNRAERLVQRIRRMENA
jgi:lysozyme